MSCDFPDLGDWGGLIPAEIEEVAAQRSEDLAWSTMLGLCAGRVTLCPITVWPTALLTSVTAATVVSTATAPPADATVAALQRPVGQIVEVRLSGVVFDPVLYRVEGNTIRRLDGQDWPTITVMTLPVGQGEFEVTYYQGQKPGPSFLWAVGQLAAEFYLALVDVKGKKCRLPSNVTAVTRQGVSYEIDPGIFSDGLTGIKEIDAIVRMYNPNTLKQATLVMSPDSIASGPLIVSTS